MIFFSRQMSERLAKLGCKSESRYAYFNKKQKHPSSIFATPGYLLLKPYVPALSQNDLTGCHPQARENARLVWGSEIIQEFYYTVEHGEVSVPARAFVYHRHAMLDTPDAEKYLEETLA